MSEDFKSIKSRRMRIASLVRKELTTLFKDKISLFILFIIPVVMFVTIGMGSVSLLADTQVNVNVLDYDNTTKSHELIASMRANLTITSNWDMPEMTMDEFLNYTKALLPTNKLAAYIIIQAGFEADLLVNKTTHLEIHIDGISVIQALTSQTYIQLALVTFQLQNMVFERDIFYFPEMRPPLDLTNLLQIAAPEVLGMILFATINLVATQCICGDIPLKRLLTTPVYRSEVVIGKTISYGVVSVFQIILSLLILRAFNVSMYGLFIDIFIVCWLCSLTGITMGICFSAVSKTRLQAAQMFLFAFMVMLIITLTIRNPFVLPFLPLEQMSYAFSSLAYRGMSLGEISNRILFMLMDSAIFFVFTIIYLKRKKEFV
jgi:ABC-2 type transport system permease protein